MTDSLLARAKLITGCTDAELAEVVGLGLPRVASYTSGNRREYLNAEQISALNAMVAKYAETIAAMAAEFSLFA